MQSADEPAAAPALRLIFEHTGTDVRLIAQQPVDVAVSGYELHPDIRPGHYVELRDDAGRPLGRVPVHSAFTGSTEVFPEDHSQPITRIETPDRVGAFTVVVPRPPTAARVAVIRVTSPPVGEVSLRARPTAAALGEPTVTELADFALEPEQ